MAPQKIQDLASHVPDLSRPATAHFTPVSDVTQAVNCVNIIGQLRTHFKSRIAYAQKTKVDDTHTICLYCLYAKPTGSGEPRTGPRGSLIKVHVEAASGWKEYVQSIPKGEYIAILNLPIKKRASSGRDTFNLHQGLIAGAHTTSSPKPKVFHFSAQDPVLNLAQMNGHTNDLVHSIDELNLRQTAKRGDNGDDDDDEDHKLYNLVGKVLHRSRNDILLQDYCSDSRARLCGTQFDAVQEGDTVFVSDVYESITKLPSQSSTHNSAIKMLMASGSTIVEPVQLDLVQPPNPESTKSPPDCRSPVAKNNDSTDAAEQDMPEGNKNDTHPHKNAKRPRVRDYTAEFVSFLDLKPNREYNVRGTLAEVIRSKRTAATRYIVRESADQHIALELVDTAQALKGLGKNYDVELFAIRVTAVKGVYLEAETTADTCVQVVSKTGKKPRSILQSVSAAAKGAFGGWYNSR